MSGLRFGGDPVTGRPFVTVSQSWLNEFFNCPELARRKALTGLKDGGTDATAIGTGLHSGAEAHLIHGLGFDACLEAAIASFRKEAQHPQFRYVQVGTEATAIKYLTTCFTSWWNDVRPKVGKPLAIEWPFKVLLYAEEHYDVYLTGVLDCVDDNGIIWDWKTANDAEKYGKRKHWEYQRWSIQPTAYDLGWFRETGEHATFIFACVLKGASTKPAQFVPVTRDDTHAAWLEAQIRPIMALVQALPQGPWPLRDQQVLCSPKWCPAWDDCKGKFVTM